MQNRKHRAAGRTAGYSLIEIVVVLALFGALMSMVAASMMQSLPRWRAVEAAHSVAGTIKGARARAILNGETAAMPFDIGGGRYTVIWGPSPAGTRRVTVGATTTRVATLPRGVRFVRPDVGEVFTFKPGGVADGTVAFDPRGILVSSETPGYVYVGDPEHALYFRIKVNLAGTIAVQKWVANGGTGQWR